MLLDLVSSFPLVSFNESMIASMDDVHLSFVKVWLISIKKFLQFSFLWCFRFESVYLDEEIRVAKDIRGDYLVVDRAPYSWTEWNKKVFFFPSRTSYICFACIWGDYANAIIRWIINCICATGIGVANGCKASGPGVHWLYTF